MKHFKLNGHGYKKGRTWNLAHLLPRRRLALLPDAPTSNNATPTEISTPQVSSTPANDVKPQISASSAPEPHASTTQQVNTSTPPEPAEPAPLPAASGSALDAIKPESPASAVQQFNGSTPDSPTRVGKIARLPEDIREDVNHMLRHNRTYSKISEELAKLGYPGISPGNICNWKHGGFIDWYREQQQRDVALAPLKALERCTRAVEIDRWQQNAVTIAAEKFAMIMVQFNQQRAVEALHANPELLPKYISAMTALSRCTTELAKSFDLTQKRQAALQADLVDNSAPVPDPAPEAPPSATPKPAVDAGPDPEDLSNPQCEPPGLNRIQPNSTRFNQITPNSAICPSIMPDFASEQR